MCHVPAFSARVFPEFKVAPEWQRRALARITDDVVRNTLPDGGYVERSAYNYGVIDTLYFDASIDRFRQIVPQSPEKTSVRPNWSSMNVAASSRRATRTALERGWPTRTTMSLSSGSEATRTSKIGELEVMPEALKHIDQAITPQPGSHAGYLIVNIPAVRTA